MMWGFTDTSNVVVLYKFKSALFVFCCGQCRWFPDNHRLVESCVQVSFCVAFFVCFVAHELLLRPELNIISVQTCWCLPHFLFFSLVTPFARSEFLPPSAPATLACDADVCMFRAVITDPGHVLHKHLPEAIQINYNLRPRALRLPLRTTGILFPGYFSKTRINLTVA